MPKDNTWGRNVKVSDETFDMLYEKAESLGVSLNDVIRQMDKKCGSMARDDVDDNQGAIDEDDNADEVD